MSGEVQAFKNLIISSVSHGKAKETSLKLTPFRSELGQGIFEELYASFLDQSLKNVTKIFVISNLKHKNTTQ